MISQLGMGSALETLMWTSLWSWENGHDRNLHAKIMVNPIIHSLPSNHSLHLCCTNSEIPGAECRNGYDVDFKICFGSAFVLELALHHETGNGVGGCGNYFESFLGG